MSEPRHVVLAVGIDHGAGARQLLVGLVVIDDDDVAAELAGARQRLAAGGAAVDGDDELGAVLDEPFDGRRVRAVAFEQAVGDVDARLQPVMREEAAHQSGGRGAVDVVVAEDGDRLALLDRIGETRGRRLHVAHAVGIGHQRLQGGIEHDGNVVERHAAPGEHAAEQLRQSVPLADGGGAQLRFAGEALAPLVAARRHRHPEERRRAGRIVPPLAHRAHGLPPQ